MKSKPSKNLFGISYLEPPRGETKKLIDKLIDSKKWGKNEGGDEIIAVAELLAGLEKRPYLNSLVLKNSPIWQLAREFAQAFFPGPPKESKLLEYLVTKHQWDELPIYCIGFSNATNALTACLQAHGVEGGEVITTSYNYAAAPNAIVAAGAKPVFVDIDPATFSMDFKQAAKAIGKKTRAVLLTLVNQAVDLLPLIQTLDKKGKGIALLQDVTTATGSVYEGLGAGQINPPPHGASVFSLGPTKVVSGLGGALVVAHDFEFLQTIEAISFYGLNPANDEETVAFGSNYKMNEISAVIAFEQLKKREKFVARRREIKKMYDEALAPLVKKGLVTLQKLNEGAVVTHYMVKLNRNYRDVIERLGQQYQIGLSHWRAYHLDPLYRLRFGSQVLKITEALSDKIIFLPFHLELTEADVKHVAKSLEAVLREA